MSGPASGSADRRGHVCPPSDAAHPSDRWESMFIYSFICKFTNLRAKVEGLETPMDLEEALLSREPNTILTELLARFILNLKPQTRNLSIDQISTTVASVLGDYLKSNERTIFWDDYLKLNKDPFEDLDGGFFSADWDFKLKILRQLVELQLTHNSDIKNTIDRAWGVSHRKKDTATGQTDSSEAATQAELQHVPIGQDVQRKRYWVVDDSPRLYVSTNPWKITATFQTVASTREEYLEVIENLKKDLPTTQLKKGERRSKMELSHISLVSSLEERIDAIDIELARVEKARKKIEQRRAAIARAAQVEVRTTRTRRQARKPDYVYNNADFDDEDDGDFNYQDTPEMDDEFEEFDDDDDRPSRRAGTRRSTRTAVVNANNQRQAATEPQWRGERRSLRLGAAPDTQLDLEPPKKRARTEDSTMSSSGAESSSHAPKFQPSGAAALRPNEVAMEQVAGKRKSKFWVYAVEGASDPEPFENGGGGGGADETIDAESQAESMDIDTSTPVTNGKPNGVDHAEDPGSPMDAAA